MTRPKPSPRKREPTEEPIVVAKPVEPVVIEQPQQIKPASEHGSDDNVIRVKPEHKTKQNSDDDAVRLIQELRMPKLNTTHRARMKETKPKSPAKHKETPKDRDVLESPLERPSKKAETGDLSIVAFAYYTGSVSAELARILDVTFEPKYKKDVDFVDAEVVGSNRCEHCFFV